LESVEPTCRSADTNDERRRTPGERFGPFVSPRYVRSNQVIHTPQLSPRRRRSTPQGPFGRVNRALGRAYGLGPMFFSGDRVPRQNAAYGSGSDKRPGIPVPASEKKAALVTSSRRLLPVPSMKRLAGESSGGPDAMTVSAPLMLTRTIEFFAFTATRMLLSL